MTTQGNVLARYSVLHELGRGAMGAVYAARDRETGAVVALKRLDPAVLSKSDANFASRFLKHARSARLLQHRNIARIHDAGEVGGTVYVAMEMLEGQSLRRILEAGPVPIARAIQIAHDIACGLAHAHLEGVVHGAIKPSNVIVLRSGVVKITDFGIGQLEQAAQLSGARAGCLSYMSPEQLRGGPVDHRCDIFSLGALFYEMLTHRAPFGGGAPKEITENILRAKPPLPSELNQHVPRALDAIVLSMLAGEPVARMPGAPILLRELQRIEEGLGLGSAASGGTDEPAASVPPAKPEPRPRPPDANRFRDGAPMQKEPRFVRPSEARDASGVGIRADSPAAEDFQHRNRIADPEAFDYQKAMAMMERESRPKRSSGSRPAIFAAALLLAVLGTGFAGFMYYSSGPSEQGIGASRMQEAPAPVASRPPAPAPVAEAPVEPAPAPVAEATGQPAIAPDAPEASPPHAVDDGQAEQAAAGILSAPNLMPPTPRAAEPSPAAQTESLAARASEQPASAGAARAQEAPRAMQAPQPSAKVPEQPPGGTAQVIVAVSPRGEIYINGKHHGTTPPITTFHLEPGMHRIEVRSGSRKPYLTYMAVQAGDKRRIRHDFNASRAVPPQSASWQNSDRRAR
jgi:serine/threonine protein kinase